MGWSPQNNLQPAATDMLYFDSEIRLGLSVVKVLSWVLLACTCGPEHPISPPVGPRAPPLTFPVVKGKCGEVQQSTTNPTRSCLSYVALIENHKATPMAMSDQLRVNHSETSPEKSVCEVSS